MYLNPNYGQSKDKSLLCKFYNSSKGCFYGNKCKYIHETISEIKKTFSKDYHEKIKCKYWENGNCFYGNSCKFFHDLNLRNNNIKVDFKLLKTYNADNYWINLVKTFPLGNFLIISDDKSIKIFDINFNIIQNIKNAHKKVIIYTEIKDENNFVTCSDKSIKTWIKINNKFKINKYINNAHKEQINKVIYYSNLKLISCSNDNKIKIWEEINNKFQLIITLLQQDNVNSILLIEDKNKFISSGKEGTKIWNINNLELIKHFNDIKCYDSNGLCKIDKDKFIINEYKLLIVISLTKEKIIKSIINLFKCTAIHAIEKKGIFIIGRLSNDITIYRNDNFECILTIQDAHFNTINGFIDINDDFVVSFTNLTIKIWSL